MGESTIAVAEVVAKEYGVPSFFTQGDFQGALVVRIRTNVPGAIPLRDDFVVGFGVTCTHMGCVLVDEETTSNIVYRPKDGNEGLVCGPCPCHGTSFDLRRSGLVVLGPATQNLPQLILGQREDLLVATGWILGDQQAADPSEENWPNG